jgi:hypothetical protein
MWNINGLIELDRGECKIYYFGFLPTSAPIGSEVTSLGRLSTIS